MTMTYETRVVIMMANTMRDTLEQDARAAERTLSQTIRLACREYIERHAEPEQAAS